MSKDMKSSGAGTFFKIILIIILITGLAAIILMSYRGYQSFVNGQNTTVIVQNQTVNNVDNSTTILKQGPSWPLYLTLFFLMIAVGIIIYLILKNRFGNYLSYPEVVERTFRALLRHNYAFYFRHDGRWKRLKKDMVDDKRDIGAMDWLLPGSGVYFQGRDIRFKRALLRFWCYPKPLEQQQPDWEPPRHEIRVVSVSCLDVWDKWQNLKAMTADECEIFKHDQEYGRRVSPEPSEAASIFELRRMEGVKAAEQEVFKQTVKEGIQGDA